MVVMFLVGLFSRARLTTRHPVITVYAGLALGIGLLAGVGSYYLLDTPGPEAVATGALWALLMVAMPLGNAFRVVHAERQR